jgi:hypothetical protein
MKTDMYTKAVLSIIAIALIVIGCRPILSPDISRAGGLYEHLQVTSNGHGGILIFDSENSSFATEYQLDSDGKRLRLAHRWAVWKSGEDSHGAFVGYAPGGTAVINDSSSDMGRKK